jgi:hypothetical protein
MEMVSTITQLLNEGFGNVARRGKNREHPISFNGCGINVQVRCSTVRMSKGPPGTNSYLNFCQPCAVHESMY